MSDGVAQVAAPVASADRPVQVRRLLEDIFRLAEWPARFELKEVTDGSIAVAVHLEAEMPGVAAGKKSPLLESVQFLVNKAVNRPGVEKRWVSLGLNAFPEPKPSAPGAGDKGSAGAPQGGRPGPNGGGTASGSTSPPGKASSAAAARQGNSPRGGSQPGASERGTSERGRMQGPGSSAPRREDPEPADVEVSATWGALGTLLREKAVAHGRPYAVMMLTGPERAQLVKASAGPKVVVKQEGEGHFRRVAVVPQQVAPMPRKMQFPDDDEDDEG